MANFIQYIDKSLAGLKDTKSLYLFRQKIISEMTERSNELIAKGIKDDKVITELIISEYPDLKKMYFDIMQNSQTKRKKKKLSKTIVLGLLAYILVVIFAFLAISFLSNAWGKTWLIIVCGVLIPVALVLGVMASKKGKSENKGLAAASRVMLAGAIMIFAVVVFLCLLILTDVPKSWLVLLVAVPVMLVSDMIFMVLTKQKIAFVTHLIYIPVLSTILFALLGGMNIIPWHPGWLIVVVSVIVDIVYAMIKVAKEKQEEEQLWKEN